VRVLKKGIKGPDPDVLKWQWFLIGQQLLYKGEADGWFGPKTAASTKKFQKLCGLWPVDGVVGAKTYGAAMMRGFDHGGAVKHPAGQESPNWPARPKPSVLRPLTYEERQAAFGVIKWKPAPTKGNPERVIITNNWQKENIVGFVIPQLKEMAKKKPGMGFPRSGKVFAHGAMKPAFLEMYDVLEDEDLLDGIESFAGLLAIRLVRGSRTTLSNHCNGAAVDHNAYPWNPLGGTPALVGQKGSLREIAACLAKQCKFWWGGWGWPSSNPARNYKRLDGMHFEASYQLCVKLGLL